METRSSSSGKGLSGRRSVRASVLISAVLIGSWLVPNVADAATSSTAQQQQTKIKGQISQLQSQLSEVSSDEAKLLGQLDDINNKKAAVDDQITAMQGDIQKAQADMDAANARLTQVQAQMDAAKAKLGAAQGALDSSNQKMTQQAVDAYMGVQQNSDTSTLMLRSKDISEVGAATEYMSQVVQDRQSIVEENRELQGEANDAQLAVQTILNQATGDRDTVAQRQTELLSKKGQLDSLSAQAAADADSQQQLLAQADTQRASLQSQMDSLQAQSDSIAAMLRASAGTSTTPPPSGKGVLADPVPGAPLTSPFGMRLDPVLNVYQLHAGQDFGVPTGTQIHAAADGTVVSVIPTGSSGGYGNYTCISHGGGLATCYAHQSKFMVTVGQHVTRGQVIGLSGSTGYATGPHLHFEVRINGTPVNPLGYL